MNTPTHIIIDGDAIEIRQSEAHEYLVTTKEVARGYGVGTSVILKHRQRHADELVDGKHFILANGADNLSAPSTGVRIPDARQAGLKQGNDTVILWTKRGVIRLGFFIRSERAKRFRDAAEDLIIRITSGQSVEVPTSSLTALEQGFAALSRTVELISQMQGRLILGQHRLEQRADLTDQRLSALEGERIRQLHDSMRPWRPHPMSEAEALAQALRGTLGYADEKAVSAAEILAYIQRLELPVVLSSKQPANSLAKKLIELQGEQVTRAGERVTVAKRGRNRHRRYILRRS